MNNEDLGPEENMGGQSRANGPANPLPARLPREDFPHQPGSNSSSLPFTTENLEHMLDAYRISLRWDVIKKRESYEQDGKRLTNSDIISLANLNGLYNGRIDDFLTQMAMRNPQNPAKVWIESLPWDGSDRLAAFYATVRVQEDYPITLAHALLYRWLMSAVAAALSETGFHTRGVLTLQGGQGIGKTSWIARLGTPDLIKLDHHLDPGNKDSIISAASHWIVEVGELDSTFRRDIARLKGFLTAPVDKLRPPYGRRAIEMPRRTVFAASVNDPNFLVDQTGNSRWWTIACESLDFDHDIDMQQLFAQLGQDFRAGVQWWLTPEEEAQLEELNKRFQSVSVIEEKILERASPTGSYGKYMTAMQVLQELGYSNPTNGQCKEAGAALRQIYGQPKRVQGRFQWKVSMKSSGQIWQSQAPDPDEY